MEGNENPNDVRKDEELNWYFETNNEIIRDEIEDNNENKDHTGRGRDVDGWREIIEENNVGDDASEEDYESDERHGNYEMGINDQIGEDESEEKRVHDELRLAVSALWKTGLEIFIHQLLYHRRVYPKDTFSSARFAGVACKINRNPRVLVYISEALRSILPSLFDEEKGIILNEGHGQHRRRSKELQVEIYDREKGITHEQYSLFFSHEGLEDRDADVTSAALSHSFSLPLTLDNERSDLANSIMGEVEKDLRDLVCSTARLEGLRFCAWDDSVSFKVLLVMNTTANVMKPTIASDSVLDETKWFRRTETKTLSDNQRNTRVICNLANSACQFSYKVVKNQGRQQQTGNKSESSIKGRQA
ncbi:unnamed protein product [Pseudo-nitzschia multistriata]|uniref:HORMA domain-containing protein n=1 Tax=Pseudo-nitzschia multistriata TaxID=183589 RepID=A0A448ZF40_9STRA|nr:unnamed protein product [Pseudo-nitzschia multistriata]